MTSDRKIKLKEQIAKYLGVHPKTVNRYKVKFPGAFEVGSHDNSGGGSGRHMESTVSSLDNMMQIVKAGVSRKRSEAAKKRHHPDGEAPLERVRGRNQH